MKCPYKLKTTETLTRYVHDAYDKADLGITKGYKKVVEQEFMECYKDDCPLWIVSQNTCNKALTVIMELDT